MLKTLSAPIVSAPFPEGTADAPFMFTVTGTLADGSPFNNTVASMSLAAQMDLPVGTGYVLVVSKLGFNSLPSAPIDIAAPVTVSLSVPDSTQQAVIG